jgi:molecular chaperone DnaJ
VGQVRRVRQSLLGQMVTAGPCGRCGGIGQVVVTPCTTCAGEGRVLADKTYQVDVAAGVDTGATLRVSGRGAVGPRGGPPGDLYVHLMVAKHERFVRDGFDLVCEVPVSVAQAALGCVHKLATLDGEEELAIPPGTQPGRTIFLRNRGVPHLGGRGRGDLRVVVRVDVPTKLSAREAELLRQFAAERGEAVNEPETGLFSRLKSKLT